MRQTRRRFLTVIATGAVAAVLPGCGPQNSSPQTPAPYEPGKSLPWVNWAATQYCYPRRRLAPATETELADALRDAKGKVRAVGSGHSFTALVPTDDTLIATDLLAGIVGSDAATLEAEIWAGTRLHDAGQLLLDIGQVMPAQPDVDYFALGGAIATSAHGSGTGFGSLSSYVTGLTLVTPRGELVECSASKNSDIFNAARVSLGALGIITRVRLKNERSLNLTETNRVEDTEDVLADLENRFGRHRHFEFLPLVNSNLCLTVTTDPSALGDKDVGFDDPQAVHKLRTAFDAVSWMPWAGQIYGTLVRLVGASTNDTIRTGPSHSVLPHPRLVRFREMEYIVPAEAGPACAREILRTIGERRIPVCFPMEYRRVAADDIWLSMFQGRESAAIAVHQFADLDYKSYFAEIEPIFWKYDGRPHWGKLHTLDAKRLAGLYPKHWKDFLEIRHTLDPQGKMLNPHLKAVFGV
ncbi:FAD-binding protein [Bradyrhizobium manausense]|uniref:D-arabinono-1,4-lactone oxidase n=1 Tax=Bradyrhizobium manausense TaxID=989370 RepID=UPI001BA51BEA|nr:D-arabinono-1,4-lactone oxidase [Bradyrhizobium manausense]MBR0834270.1 FAD-binding protein [Bradyrhizobium manausense]